MVRHRRTAVACCCTILAIVGLLVLRSTAHASGWGGKMTVEVTSGGSGKVVGWGANDGHSNHCPTKPWSGQAAVHAGDATHPSGTLTITVEPSTPAEAGACASQLSDGTYDVRFLNTGFGEYVGVEPARMWLRECMHGTHSSAFTIGTLTVTSGYGVAVDVSIDKPANHPRGQAEIADLPGTESAVCVAHPTRWHDGMQNPITVI